MGEESIAKTLSFRCPLHQSGNISNIQERRDFAVTRSKIFILWCKNEFTSAKITDKAIILSTKIQILSRATKENFQLEKQ